MKQQQKNLEVYNLAAQQAAAVLTQTFSTSFSRSIRFFKPEMQTHIYNIYGLVRVADEVVDSYQGTDSLTILSKLEEDTYQAIKSGYSSNIIIHAFSLTAQHYGIGKDLIKPFFDSMRIDINPETYKVKDYQRYIHGSAEVVGLMCLKVFCGGNQKKYDQLKDGAAALGSAFQKVNFLRDLADDYNRLGRYYFPVGNFETFDKQTKDLIVADIEKDLRSAKQALDRLPKDSRVPVAVAYEYYLALLKRLKKQSAETIKRQRLRVSDPRKRWIVVTVLLKQRVKK